MIVNVTLVGDKAIIARLKEMPSAVNQALYVKVLALSLKLEKYVKTGKLNGQVLNRITGALSRSIFSGVDRRDEAVFGRVYSSGDVKYAAIHEYGGVTAPHVIYPKKASVLAFMKGGQQVFARKVNHPGSRIPERSFLRSGLSDMATEISTEMKQAVVKAIVQKVHGT